MNKIQQIKKYYNDAFRYNAFTMCVLLYKKLNISYNFIPKIGCSSLKKTLGSANETLNETDDVHESDRKHICLSFSEHHNTKKLIVLRNPQNRVLSAYLDKIAIPSETFAWDCCYNILTKIRGVNPSDFQDIMHQGQTPTFREFVTYLSITDDSNLDTHWRSQLSLMAFDEYDFIFSLENLYQQWNESELTNIKITSVKWEYENKLVNSKIFQYQRSQKNILHHDYFGSEVIKFLKIAGNQARILLIIDSDIKKCIMSRFFDDICYYESVFKIKCAP
jgi:hypothetical protein